MPKFNGLDHGIETIKAEFQKLLAECGESLMVISKEVDIPEPGLNRFKNHGTGISPEKLDRLAAYFGFEVRVELVKKKGK